jgi:hypothetical protein
LTPRKCSDGGVFVAVAMVAPSARRRWSVRRGGGIAMAPEA